eukprot:CAMPEP_0180311152 /NCGR_PEP_ID=MMETSP0988-20121125/30099_1 /TAXON_ID=697907 /ORGANISM="non described non described, Strain CCMP2293" /LENGTH=164 /DNA_ID=CAMNT_0022295217 /DNA_START=289 /DNA_END=783 /DNA_ORIENTATION=-
MLPSPSLSAIFHACSHVEKSPSSRALRCDLCIRTVYLVCTCHSPSESPNAGKENNPPHLSGMRKGQSGFLGSFWGVSGAWEVWVQSLLAFPLPAYLSTCSPDHRVSPRQYGRLLQCKARGAAARNARARCEEHGHDASEAEDGEGSTGREPPRRTTGVASLAHH